MLSKTFINKYKWRRFKTNLQRVIVPEFGIRIRQTKASYPLWELSCENPHQIQWEFDNLTLYGARQRMIVETVNNQFSIKQTGKWYTQLLNIEPELTL